MNGKINNNNQVSLDDLQKNINRSFVISLSVNNLLDEVRCTSGDLTDGVFIKSYLRQLNWIKDQINELDNFMTHVFSRNPDHIYRLKIKALFREIPQQIEKAQSAIIYVKLNSIDDTNNDMDNNKLSIYLYNLNNTLIRLYESLINIKIQSS